MSDIFTEVDDDLRQERAVQFWNKYRHWIIVGIVAILAGTSASVGWREYQQRQADAAGKEYKTALAQIQKGDQTGIDALSSIAKTSDHFEKLAQFQLAAKNLSAKEPEKALEWLMTLSQDKSDPAASDLAALQASYIAIDLKKHDVANSLLMPLLSEGNAYRALALEAMLLNALQMGDKQKAKEWWDMLQPIADAADAPSGLKERLSLLKTDIGS